MRLPAVEPVRFGKGVVVSRGNDLAARSGDGLVQGRKLSLLSFKQVTKFYRKIFRRLFDDRARVIGGIVVNYNHFSRNSSAASLNRIQALLQEMPDIIIDYDNR